MCPVFSQIVWRLSRESHKDLCWDHYYSVYINCLDFNIDKARIYADDTIVYCSTSSKQQSVTALQSVFDIIQNRFRFKVGFKC